MISKRFMVSLFAIAICFLGASWVTVSAQDGSPTADDCPVTSVEENIALVERLYEALSNGDAETIDAILADDYTHDLDRFGLPDDPMSNADEIELALMLREFYPNSSDVIHEVFGVDDKVVFQAQRTITEHTFTGEVTTLETPIEFRTIGIITIECGEVVNMNAMANTLQLLVGLGAIELPEIAPAATPEA